MKPTVSEFDYDMNALRARRLQLGMSFEQLGGKAQVAPNTARRIFATGRGYPRNIIAIADALGFEVSEIVIPRHATA